MPYINNWRKKSFVLTDCFKFITVGVLVDRTACFMATRKERACPQYLDFSLFPFDLPWTSPPGWCLLYSGLLFTHARVRAHIHTQDMPHQSPQLLSMLSSWQSRSATTYMYICDCLEFSQGVKPWADAFTKHSYCLLILGQHHVQADGLIETVCHQHG